VNWIFEEDSLAYLGLSKNTADPFLLMNLYGYFSYFCYGYAGSSNEGVE